MQLVINKDEYHIPSKWNQVSLRKYQLFMSTYKEDVSDAEKQLHLLSCFTGADPDAIANIPKRVLNGATKILAELVETKPNEDLAVHFEIENTEYGFHPNLADMKLKEFVDLDNALTESWENMHKIMGILYRPVTKKKGDKYDIEDYDFISANKRAELFRDAMSVELVNGAAAFFLTIAVDYMKITEAYSKVDRRTRRERIRLTKKRLARLMGGTV
ncbi:MAG: hypothetical protein GOVbin568_19 [Prokaryotic dsDNA virus sp.]|nr:MAG: hypothetical protein GOVbin568_19 [Prokaryotic dsDNA virus sp.]|tara:strand:+ start:13790 stop:14437 length:648 start_codon:yes stop_codon:yes gene_type:complete